MGAVLLGLVLGGLVGAVVAFINVMIGGDKDTGLTLARNAGRLAGIAGGFVALNYSLSRIINRNIGGKKLILVDADKQE
ncbi:MAG: hypothetical protein ABI230_04835 [Aestuariivirga sp.]